jgi:uncharacterized protein with HEPN domain
MSPTKREFILYLEDMLQSMQRIEEYLSGLDFVKFKKNIQNYHGKKCIKCEI